MRLEVALQMKMEKQMRRIFKGEQGQEALKGLERYGVEDLSKYTPTYDSENRRIPNAPYDQISLIPPIRKHTFAPEVDPTGLIDDEAEFEALNGLDWASSTFQDKTTDGEAEKDNPEPSSPPKE